MISCRAIPAAERVAVCAVTGGVPAYLERFDIRRSLTENIRELFMKRISIFRTEPFFLIGDVIRRETQTYEAVLKASLPGTGLRRISAVLSVFRHLT